MDDFYNRWVNKQPLYGRNPEAYRGQCVQLVMYYIEEVWRKPVQWLPTAASYWDTRLPDHFSYIANNPNDPNQVPPRGAVIVFSRSTPGSGGAGHIAIVWSAGANSFVSFDCNWGGKHAHLVTHDYRYVLGWFVSKVVVTPAAPSQPAQGVDEMIANSEQATLAYKLLRPNGGASQGEIDNTVGKRSWWQFVRDASGELQVRDANLANQARQLDELRGTITQLNQVVTHMKQQDTIDAQNLTKYQDMIGNLTAQLESKHDQLSDTQAALKDLQANPIVQAQQKVQAVNPKANIFTRLLAAMLRNKKSA